MIPEWDAELAKVRRENDEFVREYLIRKDAARMRDEDAGYRLLELHNENTRLRASHDRLLAVAKETVAMADLHCVLLPDGTPNRTPECQHCYERMCAAIAKAEEQAP